MTIDWWTLGIQSVNVLILIWLLGRFFWRPVAAMIAQRRTTTQATLDAADAKSSKATAALATIEATRAGFAKEREAILAAAHKEAETARTAALDAGKTAATALETAAAARIETAQAASATAWAERSSQLAVEIAGRLAARLEGPAVDAAFTGWLLADVRALPEAARRAAAAQGAAFEAVSARPLVAADEARTRTEIAAALGAEPRITFKTDPALIAGLELHGPHLALSNSWRADLARILADLQHAH